jgi:hypothetical protein
MNPFLINCIEKMKEVDHCHFVKQVKSVINAHQTPIAVPDGDTSHHHELHENKVFPFNHENMFAGVKPCTIVQPMSELATEFFMYCSNAHNFKAGFTRCCRFTIMDDLETDKLTFAMNDNSTSMLFVPFKVPLRGDIEIVLPVLIYLDTLHVAIFNPTIDSAIQEQVRDYFSSNILPFLESIWPTPDIHLSGQTVRLGGDVDGCDFNENFTYIYSCYVAFHVAFNQPILNNNNELLKKFSKVIQYALVPLP